MLPLGRDANPETCTLVSAIEACLADISITINETGFLLLVRRCWPSSRHTEYALSRLARVVLQWIFAEANCKNEESVQHHAVKKEQGPGVLTTNEKPYFS